MKPGDVLRGRPPLVGATTWAAVLDAAGDRCQCAGHCGRPHDQRVGRCERTHTSRHRLIVAPADPLTPAHEATRLPVALLRAWCPACLTAATRAARHDSKRDATTAQPLQPDLFDLPA